MRNDAHDWNHAWLRHVWLHYDRLPRHVIMIPSSFEKHGRFGMLEAACRKVGFGKGERDFCCPRSLEPKSLRRWNGTASAKPLTWFANNAQPRGLPAGRVVPAEVRPFSRWCEEYLNASRQQLHRTNACFYSLFGTSAANLRARPRAHYARLLEASEALQGLSQVAYFMEWASELIFGPRMVAASSRQVEDGVEGQRSPAGGANSMC